MGKIHNCRLFVKEMLGLRLEDQPILAQRPFRKQAPSELPGDALVWMRSDTKYVSAVRAVLSAVCAETALSPQDIDEFKLAVGEAVCNAIQHGSPCGDEDYICVAFSVSPRGVTARISDNGGPFVRKCSNRRLKFPRERGYGLHLIKSLTSAVDIKSGCSGTTVTLEKRFPAVVTAVG